MLECIVVTDEFIADIRDYDIVSGLLFCQIYLKNLGLKGKTSVLNLKTENANIMVTIFVIVAS